MRRNLKPAHTESRTPRASSSRARRTSASDFLEPMGNPETLWGEDANEEQRSDSDKEEADGDPDALDGESGAPAEEKEKDGDVVSGPDDALGLYLRQMGAIPLLTREQELNLARRLERARTRYRRAALASWRTVAMTLATFDAVLAGELAVDPTID